MERISITLEDDLKFELNTQIPKGERARFVANAIRYALEQNKRQQALDYLLSFKPYKGHKDSAETIRDIREERSQIVGQRSKG